MSEKVFNKVLAANRGEIAVRIFRACYDLGIHTVAMYSKEDELSLFRTRADEAYLVGENKSPLGAYLDIPEIIDLAKRRGYEVVERAIMPEELSSFSECFLTGSAAEVRGEAKFQGAWDIVDGFRNSR